MDTTIAKRRMPNEKNVHSEFGHRFRSIAILAVITLIFLSGCMLLPYDQEKVNKNDQVSFLGVVDIPNASITIEAQEPQQSGYGSIWGGTWDQIGSATSLSQGGSWNGIPTYLWGQTIEIPDAYWNKSCSSTGFSARVRSRITDGPYLFSFNQDSVSCLQQDFISCTAPQSPVARIYTNDYRDFGQECVDLINKLRATVNLPPLQRFTEGECDADQDSQCTYENGTPQNPHPCFTHGNAQDSTGLTPLASIDSILTDSIQNYMWYKEQSCYNQNPTACYDNSSCMCGHYVNMTDPKYTKVACGIYTTPSGQYVSIQNFYE